VRLRALARLLAAYAVVLVVACLAVRHHASVRLLAPSEQRIVVSRWAGGKRIERSVTEPGARPAWAPPFAGNSTLVHETVIAEGPLSLAPASFVVALVPGRDGVMAELGGKTAFATVDDLVAAQAYDHATSIIDPSLGIGTHRGTVLHLLAVDLGVSPGEVETGARVRRVRFERRLLGETSPPRITGASLDPALVKAAVHEAASYLARGVDPDGRYQYLVDAVTGRVLGGYNWPRHAGTTYFLAQAAALVDDPAVRYACLRAAARLRGDMMKDCGAHKCIAEDAEADVGSSALALVAFAEIVRTGADASYRQAVVELARFLRAQQRPDGELMHLFDRRAGKPVDVQFLYFTGEAALGLARAHRITGDPDDLRAASRALGRLSGEGWSFFGSRYYFSEEHWTCQAMSDLWERAPDPAALAFCLRWHEYQRRLQHTDGDSPFDADGSFGFGPLVTPRVTPASSRGEAAGAALDVMRRDAAAGSTSASEHARTVALLEDELRRAIAFVLRAQLRPGPRHLFAHPESVSGAVPGSAVDMQLRIDYAQHAGSMMVRWLELTEGAHP
jgi:hypothetical protein